MAFILTEGGDHVLLELGAGMPAILTEESAVVTMLVSQTPMMAQGPLVRPYYPLNAISIAGNLLIAQSPITRRRRRRVR
jgi:hypothetical protein